MYYNKYLKYKNKYKILKKNIGGSSIQCKLDVTNDKYHIYHYTDSNITLSLDNIDTTKISYTKYNYNISLTDIILILNECINKNIIMYIDNNNCTIDYIDFINILNDIITHRQSIYYNVTIINKLVKEEYSLKHNLKFKKIINVISTLDISTILDYNTTKICIDNTSHDTFTICSKKDNKYNIKINEQQSQAFIINRDDNEYQYILINIDKNSHPVLLNKTWWYSYYFNIPICAYRRLLQSSGTCWCNALLNSILLNTSIIKSLLKPSINQQQRTRIGNKYGNTIIENKLLSLINDNSSTISEIDIKTGKATLNDFNILLKDKYHLISLKIIILYILYTIIIKNNKATNLSGNIVLYIAWKIKLAYTEQDIITYETNIEKYKNDGIQNLNNNYIEKLNKLITDKKNEITKLNESLDNGNEGDPSSAVIVVLPLLFDNILVLKKINNEYYYNENKLKKNGHKYIISKCIDTYDIILVIYESINSTLDNESSLNESSLNAYAIIIFNNQRYKCTSSVLSLVGASHAIAGLECNNRYYVYDSNNYITYTNWTKWNLQDPENNNYRTLLKNNQSGTSFHYNGYDTNITQSPPYTISYVMYTKEEI